MQEATALKVSIWATVFFVLLGAAWGIATSSAMILFDSVYSLASLGLSFLALRILGQVQGGCDDARFPFGKAHFEPLFVLVKSFFLIGMCAFAVLEAVSVLLGDGNYVAPGMAVIYAIIGTLGCAGMAGLLHRTYRRHQSSLVHAERNQWLGDTLMSAGVLCGFLAAFWMEVAPCTGWCLTQTRPWWPASPVSS